MENHKKKKVDKPFGLKVFLLSIKKLVSYPRLERGTT